MSAAALSPAAAAGIAACRNALGPRPDRMQEVWLDLDERERAFWLGASRLPVDLAKVAWSALPGDARATIRNNLFRAAKRADAIIRLSGWPH